MEALKRLVLNWMFGDKLKKVLDLIPANGLKTVAGVVLIVLSAFLSYYGADSSVGSIIGWLMDAVKQLDPIELRDVGVATVIFGVVHKLLKWLDSE